MNAIVPGDLPILYILIAIVILLALLAAIGAWVRGGGISRQDAESLFNDSQERHREEILKLETALERSRAEAAEALTRTQTELAGNMRELNEQLVRARTELETVVSQSAKSQQESLSGELQTVSQMLSDHERRTGAGLEGLNTSVQSLNSQVKLAGDSMNRTLMEMARQQRDQKAQSTIQLCEALITSLGTLKSTIANQITHTFDVNTVNAEQVSEPEALTAPQNAEWRSPFADESGVQSDEQEDVVAVEDDSSSFTSSPFTDGASDADIQLTETDNVAAEQNTGYYGNADIPSPDEDVQPFGTSDAAMAGTPDEAMADNTESVDTNHDLNENSAGNDSFEYDRDRRSF